MEEIWYYYELLRYFLKLFFFIMIISIYVMCCVIGVDIVSFVGNNMGVGGVCLVGSYCLEVIIIFLFCFLG